MNKEDSAVKVIQGWTDPDIDMHPGRLSMSLLLRANANPGDVPCGVVIGSNAIPEGEVVPMLREMRSMFREWRGHDGSPDGYATIDLMFVDEFDAILRKNNITL